MPPDPTRIADTKAWLTKAAQDLRRVEILLAADPPDAEGAHCITASRPPRKLSRVSSLGTTSPFGKLTSWTSSVGSASMWMQRWPSW
jgi:hypothetical protein